MLSIVCLCFLAFFFQIHLIFVFQKKNLEAELCKGTLFCAGFQWLAFPFCQLPFFLKTIESQCQKRISPKTVQYTVKQFLHKAGLDGYSVHKLRHTAATLMYQYGDTDLLVLKEILGHENVGTTQIYTHIVNAQLEEAINSNPLANIMQNDQTDK